MKKISFSRKHLGIPYALFLVMFVIFPLLLIVFYAFTDANGHITFINFINFFKSNANLTALFISLGLEICNSYMRWMIFSICKTLSIFFVWIN